MHITQALPAFSITAEYDIKLFLSFLVYITLKIYTFNTHGFYFLVNFGNTKVHPYLFASCSWAVFPMSKCRSFPQEFWWLMTFVLMSSSRSKIVGTGISISWMNLSPVGDKSLTMHANTISDNFLNLVISHWKELRYQAVHVFFWTVYNSVFCFRPYAELPGGSQMAVLLVIPVWPKMGLRVESKGVEQHRGSHSSELWFCCSVRKVTTYYSTDFLQQSNNFQTKIYPTVLDK